MKNNKYIQLYIYLLFIFSTNPKIYFNQSNADYSSLNSNINGIRDSDSKFRWGIYLCHSGNPIEARDPPPLLSLPIIFFFFFAELSDFSIDHVKSSETMYYSLILLSLSVLFCCKSNPLFLRLINPPLSLSHQVQNFCRRFLCENWDRVNIAKQWAEITRCLFWSANVICFT